jgi:cbb3-type cytochrome c oxidase subunit III
MRLNKHLILWSSLGSLALLMWSAYEENVLPDWRGIQTEYRRRLSAEQETEFSVQLRQVVVPSLGVADRCVSCHLGMAPGVEAIRGDPLFGPHPDIPHDPMELGCTSCHGGQGRATVSADAHGDVDHWPEPMLPVRFASAGCGTCHTHLAIPNIDQVNRQVALLERRDCLACHRLDGRGGTLRPGGAAGMEGPDLSRVGLTGFRPDWYEDHLAEHRAAREGPWRHSFAEVPEAPRHAIELYLRTRIGAPGLVDAKALFHSLGCRGCHSVGGVGGDDGPDLTAEGLLDPARLDFTHVPGERTIENWLAEHFRSPAKLVPGSQMPVLGLREEQIATLTFYLLSLRRRTSAEAEWPMDRVRAERLDEREFSTDPDTLYQTFCAACHGPNGEGMRYPGMAAFPAIGNAEFLAIASDDFLRQNIQHGRPGRRMPAWGDNEGGLRPEEIEAIIGHLRTLGGGARPAADGRPTRWVDGDLDLGGSLFTRHCAGCHDKAGQGLEGPALANPNLLRSATDTYLFETIRRGRSGTSMPAFSRPSTLRPALTDAEIESLVAFLRTWEVNR